MKQKFMWIFFKMGLSLFTPDYMSQGREIDKQQEREDLQQKSQLIIRLTSFLYVITYFIYFYCIVLVESTEQKRPQGIRQRYGLLGRWSVGGFY